MVMLMEREREGWVPSGCMMELGSFAGAWEGFLFLGTGGEDRSGVVVLWCAVIFVFPRGGDGISGRWEDVMRGITMCKRNLWYKGKGVQKGGAQDV